MRHVELARTRAALPPRLDEGAVLRELHDPRIDVAVRDKDLAVRRDGDIGRAVERVGTVARDAGLAERHQQLTVARVLEDLLPFAVAGAAVGEPEESVTIDPDAVLPDELLVSPALEHSAIGIELDDRRLCAMEREHAPV